MLLKKWFGGVMACLCITYAVIFPIAAFDMQLGKASRAIAISNSKKAAPARIKQQTLQPHLEDKPSIVKSKTTGSVTTNTAMAPQSETAKPVVTLSNYQYGMLVRIISAEAKGEPLEGQVAVGAVILNRIKSGRFPATVSENVLKPGQFEPVANGHIWRAPAASAYKAARLALQGWDPSYGALYFYNPAKSSSRWIWSRKTITRIGDHVFAV